MRFVRWLVGLQLRVPAVPLAVIAIVTGLLAARLEVREPESLAAQELRIVLEGQPSALRAFGDEVATRLRALPPSTVSDAQAEPGEATEVVVVRIPSSADPRAMQHIQAAVANVQFPTWPSVRVSYVNATAEARAPRKVLAPDAVIAAGLALAASLLLAALQFRRARPVIAAFVVGAVAMVWTLGVAQLAIGRLTVGAALVMSVTLAPSVVFLARYFRERTHRQSIVRALRRARFAVSHSAVLAALAAALLTARMSREDFGIILATAIVTGWTLAVVMLPSLLVLFQSIAPEGNLTPAPRPFDGRAFSAR